MNPIFTELRAWLRTNLVSSDTLVFILVLASSYGFVRTSVLGVLMVYLSDRFENNLRKAAIVENVRDGLSSIFVVVTHLAESYAGRFNVIILWTAANVIGLMLLWISSETSLHNGIFYVGLILVALGDTMDSTLEDFLEYQLEEKVKQSADAPANSTSSNPEEEENEVNSKRKEEEGKEEENEVNEVNSKRKEEEGKEEENEVNSKPKEEENEINSKPKEEENEVNSKPKEEENEINSKPKEEENEVNRGWIWWKGALLVGSLMAWMLGDAEGDWTTKFKIAALIMGAAYFWFYFGCFSYNYEEPCGSPLYKVYKVFMAALWRLQRKLPASEDGYYPKNPNHKRDGQMGLTRRVPFPWRWLDKAIKDRSELQETKGEPCSVEEVGEVKSVALLINFSMTLLPCSLVKAAASTFFIEQTSDLEDSDNIALLLLLKFCFRELMVGVFWYFKLNRERQTINRIRAGMLSSVACCIVAFGLEIYRLSVASATIYIMIPQFLLLGLTEGLAFKGFEKFFCDNVPASMWSLKEVYTGFLLGVGKLLSLLFVIFITGWFKDSINKSRVYWYYLTLAFLNLAALIVFSYYSRKYANKDGGTTEMARISGQSGRESPAQEVAIERKPEVLRTGLSFRSSSRGRNHQQQQ